MYEPDRLFLVAIVGTLAREINRPSSSSRSASTSRANALAANGRGAVMDPLNRARRTPARAPIIGRLDWFRCSVEVGTRLPLDRPRRNGECGMDQPPPAQGSHRTLWRKREWVRRLRVPRVRARWPHGDRNLFEVQPPRNSKIPPTIACQHGFRRREGLPEELTGSRSIFRRARISNKLVLRQLKTALSM
jgi:hypothetical protein